MSKKCYPSKILPHATYRHRLGIERLLANFPDLMVVRMVAGTPLEYSDEIDGEEVLLPSVFRGNMANLSMNLAGGLFDTARDAHLGFLPKSEEATNPWDYASHSADMLKDEDSYEYCNPCFGLCFRVDDIHWKTFPYLRHFDNQ